MWENMDQKNYEYGHFLRSNVSWVMIAKSLSFLEFHFFIQLAITCSKLTIETLEQVNNKDTNGVVQVPLLLTLSMFHTLF